MQGWDRERDAVVKETYLSRKPAAGSAYVALGSVLLILAASLVYWSDAFQLASLFPASRDAVFTRGEYWRLVTSMLVHADFSHFLSNGVVLGVLAFLLFGYYGTTVYPALTVLFGTIVTAISLGTYPAQTRLVGASGLVYLMAGFWLALYLLIERRFSWTKRVVRAVGFGLIVLVPTAIEPAVSYRTHFIGFVVGVGFAIAYFAKLKQKIRAAERIELDY